MNLIEEMRQALPILTKSEAKAAQAILDDPPLVLNASITAIAQSIGTSNSALIRMSQKLGFEGFSEFRFSMNRAMLAHETASGNDAESQEVDETAQLISVYCDYLKLIPSYVSDMQVEKLARAIIGANRISIWGVNRTAESAIQLSHRLTRLGIYNKWTDDSIVMSDDAEILTKGDVCIVFTFSGRGNARYEELMGTMRDRGVDVHLVTMNKKLDLHKHASETYYLPWISRDNSINFFEDQMMGIMFIEIVLLKIARLLS